MYNFNMYGDPQLKRQTKQLLVGTRFTVAQYEEDARAGQSSVVIDSVPLSGPIYLMSDGEHFFSQCRNCGGESKLYKGPYRWPKRWAHLHRCI